MTRAIAVALAAGVAMVSQSAAPVVLVAIPQQDAYRSYLDPPSASVSADGRYVAFTSRARLVPLDHNDNVDLYVLDRSDGRLTLESPENSSKSGRPSISDDGRLIVYDTNGKVALLDRQHRIERLLADGTEPTISADGQFVAFTSIDDVYLLEVESGAIRRVSTDGAGSHAPSGASVTPSVSANGRYVAFASTAQIETSPAPKLPNTAGGRRPLSSIYIADMRTGTTAQVGVSRDRPNGNSWAPAISADGRWLAFVSSATNLVPGDRNRSPDVFLADLDAGSLQLVSRGSKGATGNGPGTHPSVSADGRFVAFQSTASDLVCTGNCVTTDEDINLLWDVFLFDRQTQAIRCISRDATGGWIEPSTAPALDGGGGVLVFSSRHPINASDVRNDFDLFIASQRHAEAQFPPVK